MGPPAPGSLLLGCCDAPAHTRACRAVGQSHPQCCDTALWRGTW